MHKFLFRQALNLLQIFDPKLNILIYHRVMPEKDPLRPWEIDTVQFRRHMEWISGVFNVIPLSEAVVQLKNGTLKRRSLAITFDDGYLDNATEALPILKEFGFHATFFCTSAWLEGGIMWNDQVIETIRQWPENTISIDALGLVSLPIKTTDEKNKVIEIILPKLKYLEQNKRQEIADTLASKVGKLPQLMMKTKNLRTLCTQGMEIGGHTHSHPIIASLDDETLKKEIFTNKTILEKTIGDSVRLFAYPNGKPGIDYKQNQIQHIKNARYTIAVTTEPNAVNKNSRFFELPRFTPWDKSSYRFIIRMALSGLRN